MNLSLIAIGKIKSGPAKDFFGLYQRRLIKDISVKEIEVKSKGSSDEIKRLEQDLILQAIPPRAFVILLDEKGENITSESFADKLQNLMSDKIVFIIGGAHGVTPLVKARANLLLSFGKWTWPHMMVRVLLVEQIYRAQQIHLNHPYHKE
ncbi:MAG: 23S rRNA (pseudouridine(1915)-N(3))-methyltransferase RlmH [Janthinobacterium lividum]